MSAVQKETSVAGTGDAPARVGLSSEQDDAEDLLSESDHGPSGPRPSIQPPESSSRNEELIASHADELAPVVRDARLAVHDRTHLEWDVEYAFRRADGGFSTEFKWEAYFFAPESLRLDSRTYDKQDVYADLQSYVRFSVPVSSFAELTGDRLQQVVDAGRSWQMAPTLRNERGFLQELRLFSCSVRAVAGADKSNATRAFAANDADALRWATHVAESIDGVLRAFRNAMLELREHVVANDRTGNIETAISWVDEDLSRLAESTAGQLCILASRLTPSSGAAEPLRKLALSEAEYRQRNRYDSPALAPRRSSALEHIEFRRHVLKRFASTALWLAIDVRPASEWLLHLLYALAAGVAMAFATAAALWNGNDASSGGIFRWLIVAIVAYAAKDRLKAFLQTAFANVVSRHFPDRQWTIHTRDRSVKLGEMDEQSGFVAFDELPEDVLAVRRATRRHALEEEARPETVLFHRKSVDLKASELVKVDPRFHALTEIVRLDLRRWLVHTDDPKRDFVFADLVAGSVHLAKAPRVYNLAVIYRVSRNGRPAAWRRARVVVTRKGIRRVEEIEPKSGNESLAG